MHKKAGPIPVNTMADPSGDGIAIEKLTIADVSDFDKIAGNGLEEARQAHRHNAHSFFLLERGTVTVDIDFTTYEMKPGTVIYIHPNQVHRTTAFTDVTVSAWAITNENLTAEYLALLEDITPVKPLVLDKETFAIVSEAVSLCIRFSERRDDRLYHSLLKDGCHTLVALVLSQYLPKRAATNKVSRFETVSKLFRELLERNYTNVKRPAGYAQLLTISVAYLNECVKNATGYPVSYHIQQRVVLEAKRLLYHSNKSVKEIAAQLGYDDYPYFSRLFVNVAGMTAADFRNKNRD